MPSRTATDGFIGVSPAARVFAAICAVLLGTAEPDSHRARGQEFGSRRIPHHDDRYENDVKWLSYAKSDFPKTLFQWSRAAGLDNGDDSDEREPLVTDRPDFTESSSTVGRREVQLEMGYTYITDRSAAERFTAHSYPEALLRVGVLAEWLELRAACNFADELTHAGGHRVVESGAEDLYVGIKLALTEQHQAWPEMALIPQMLVPVGSSPFGAGRVLPGVNWTYSWELSDFLSTGGQSQINWVLDGETHREYVEFSQSWTIGFSLSERVGAYAEWFGTMPRGADTDGPQHYADGGFTYLINDDIQLDIRAGVGLNDAAHDFFSGAGISLRY